MEAKLLIEQNNAMLAKSSENNIFAYIIIVVSNVNKMILNVYFLHLQLQSSVHFHFAFRHEHRVPQPLTLLHPHFTNSLQALEDTGNVLHTGSLFLSNVQPCPSGVGVCG